MNTDTLTYGPHLNETTTFDWDDMVTTIVIDPAAAEVPSDEDSIDGVELADGEPVVVAEAAPKAPKRIRKPRAKVVTEMAKEAVSEAPKAAKAKAAAPKAKAAAPKAKAAAPKAKAAPKAAKPEVVQVVDLPEGRDRTHDRHGKFVGQNDFGRTRLSKAASADRLWTDLLTTGEARVALGSEVRNIKAAASREMTPAQLDGAARNRIGQVLTQPYQGWYPTAGKGTGVFKFVVEGKGATRSLVITHIDNKRPPLLISPESQRPTKVGKIAAGMYEKGMKFKCGVKVADVKAVIAKLDDK